MKGPPPPLRAAPATASDPPDGAGDRRARLLLVDCAGAITEALRGPLGAAGYELSTCRSADGLAALLERVQPDLLLLDACPPAFTGFELSGAIRAGEHGAHMPIMILASTAQEEEVIERALYAGADDFCLVSRTRELLARVRVLLRNKRDRDRLYRVRRERDNYKRAAVIDALTGIPNRRSVEGAVSAAMAAGARFAVLFVDVDHFKSINDTFGHDIGDVVLKAVAACLQRGARGSDHCGRFGGEEFVVVLSSNVDSAAAVAVADRHRRAVEALRLAALSARAVTASLGVAVFDPERPDANAAALLHRADTALYEAKRTGRNRVVLAPPPSPKSLELKGLPVRAASIDQLLEEKLATGLAGLPVLAESAAEAMRLATDAQTDVARIARLVDRDPHLAARVISVAGSALYAGRAARATTTQQALVRIGLSGARDLLYQVVYERSGRDLPRYRREVTASFKRSVRAAVAARTLAGELGIDAPYAYLAGLLHDIGEARVYRILAQLPGVAPDAAEVADLVTRHHPRAGAGIAAAWKLPSPIIEVCASHHQEAARAQPLVRLVMAADILVRLSLAPFVVPDDDVAALNAFGVRPERVQPLLDGLKAVFAEAEQAGVVGEARK